MTPLVFTIPGPPVPYMRPAGKNGRRYTPERLRRYYAHVAGCAGAAALVQRWARVDARCLFLKLRILVPDRRVRDEDNVAKAVKDGITKCGRVWRDDVCVRGAMTWMAVDPNSPRVEVTVELCEEL